MLPDHSVSYAGLCTALKWRENEMMAPERERGEERRDDGDDLKMETTLPGLVEIYNALSFLGNAQSSQILTRVAQQIGVEMRDPLAIGQEEYQRVWSLRHLPFTERWVHSVIEALVSMRTTLLTLANHPDFQQRINTDPSVEEWFQNRVDVLGWVEGYEELSVRVMRMWHHRVERERRRDRRRGNHSAVGEWRTRLEAIL
ncbi:hypothetical protein K504DRAFT_464643, partial [Pleomassaria siparia CBS 279.74]